MGLLRRCACGLALALALPAAPAAAQVPESDLKAEFIERFTRFVEWPAAAAAEKQPNFVIGVLGKSPLVESLEKMAAGRQIHGRTVKVTVVSDDDPMEKCHVLFIPKG